MGLVRMVLRIVGSLAVVLGVWWILQGTGVTPIGFMANHVEWAYRGAGLAVAGFVAVMISRRM